MVIGKVYAFYFTGSAAIFSDAAESAIHVVATAFVAYAFWVSVRPPDTDHPYGHGKIAYFAPGFEGALIIIAALVILYSALSALVLGPELRQLDYGLLVLTGLCLVNLILGLYLVRSGRRHNSLVLESNGKHVLTDMWTTLGVIAGVGLVWLTDILWLDPVVAIAVALNIMWTGGSLIWQAIEGLTERADDAETQAIVARLEEAVARGWISSFHQLRHRRINNQVWIECHLQLPGELTLDEAHDRSHRVEDALDALFEDDVVIVTAHLEPDIHDEAHPEGHREPEDPLRGISVL